MGSNQSIQFFTGINPPYNNVQKDMFGRKQRNASTGPASILTGKLDPIEQKRDIARKRAYKIMSDAYAGEKKIDDDIKNRLGLMDHYLSMYGEANDKLREIDDRKEALRQEYGVDKDSQEQKDLEILEKYNDIKERSKLESDDLMRALELVNKGYQDGYTEYQRRALEIHKGREPYLDQLTEAKKGLIEESGALRSIALERLKYHPIVDALEDADKVMENLSDEIKGMLMDEAVDHVDEKSEEEILLVTDGGYDGQDNIALAKEKNVHLVTTALIGKEAPDVLAVFEFNEDGTRLLKCAAGHVPISQSYTKSTRQCRVSFDRNHCAGCPYQEQCRPKIHKKVASFITSKNASNRAKSQRNMQSEEFSRLARLRNGVETVPSSLRKNYHLDSLPRGIASRILTR